MNLQARRPSVHGSYLRGRIGFGIAAEQWWRLDPKQLQPMQVVRQKLAT